MSDGMDERGESLVGLELGTARDEASRWSATVRARRVDGEEQMVTMDLRSDRLNVAVDDGVITEFLGVG